MASQSSDKPREILLRDFQVVLPSQESTVELYERLKRAAAGSREDRKRRRWVGPATRSGAKYCEFADRPKRQIAKTLNYSEFLDSAESSESDWMMSDDESSSQHQEKSGKEEEEDHVSEAKFQEEKKASDDMEDKVERVMFECTFCGKPFTSQRKLARHLRIHTHETPYMCKYCKKSYRRSRELRAHVARRHPHIEKHRRSRHHKAALLDESKKLEDSKDLDETKQLDDSKHLEESNHLEDDEQVVVNPPLEVNESNLISDNIEDNFNPTKPPPAVPASIEQSLEEQLSSEFPCSNTPKPFSMDQEGTGTFTCECGQAFHNFSSLNCHVVSEHPDLVSQPQEISPGQTKANQQSSDLEQTTSRTLAVNVVSPTLVAQTSQASSSDSNKSVIFSMVYKCSFCSYSFRTQEAVMEHVDKFHGTISGSPFSIEMSTKKPRLDESLAPQPVQLHASTSGTNTNYAYEQIPQLSNNFPIDPGVPGPDNNQASTEGFFKCPYCPEIFEDLMKLTLHTHLHSHGFQSYECKYCTSVTFPTLREFLNHQKQIHGGIEIDTTDTSSTFLCSRQNSIPLSLVQTSYCAPSNPTQIELGQHDHRVHSAYQGVQYAMPDKMSSSSYPPVITIVEEEPEGFRQDHVSQLREFVTGQCILNSYSIPNGPSQSNSIKKKKIVSHKNPAGPKNVTVGVQTEFRCSLCRKSYKREVNLTNHCWNVHRINPADTYVHGPVHNQEDQTLDCSQTTQTEFPGTVSSSQSSFHRSSEEPYSNVREQVENNPLLSSLLSSRPEVPMTQDSSFFTSHNNTNRLVNPERIIPEDQVHRGPFQSSGDILNTLVESRIGLQVQVVQSHQQLLNSSRGFEDSSPGPRVMVHHRSHQEYSVMNGTDSGNQLRGVVQGNEGSVGRPPHVIDEITISDDEEEEDKQRFGTETISMSQFSASNPNVSVDNTNQSMTEFHQGFSPGGLFSNLFDIGLD